MQPLWTLSDFMIIDWIWICQGCIKFNAVWISSPHSSEFLPLVYLVISEENGYSSPKHHWLWKNSPHRRGVGGIFNFMHPWFIHRGLYHPLLLIFHFLHFFSLTWINLVCFLDSFQHHQNFFDPSLTNLPYQLHHWDHYPTFLNHTLASCNAFLSPLSLLPSHFPYLLSIHY